MTNNKPKEQWGSRIGVILAVAGSAVGLGNFLRFPGQVVANGGGSFMIPYFIALLLLGLPMCWAEWTMGRYGSRFGLHSCPAIFSRLGSGLIWKVVGTMGVLVPLAIYMYYIVIETWCFVYAFKYLFGAMNLGPDPTKYSQISGEVFANIVGLKEDGFLTNGSLNITFVCWILIFTLNFFLIYKGLSKGIEKVCTYAVPLMAICALVVLVRVLTLGTPDPALPEQNVLNGLGFMWNPKVPNPGDSWWVPLSNPQVWMNAAGQIFFTLSVGIGVIINYASYLSKNDDVVLSGLTSSATNEFFEVCLGGLITVTAAFVFLGASGASGGVFGLGFNALPVVFAHMPGGNFFGFVWFFMLFLAAITSSLSMLQPGVAFIEESLNIGKKPSLAILGFILGSGSLFVIFFSKNLAALDTIDFWVGTALIYFIATMQVILFGWVFGVERGIEEARLGAEMKIPRIFKFVIKYISPVYLLIIFVSWLINNCPSYLQSLAKGGVPLFSVCLIAVFFVFLMLISIIGSKNWDKKADSNSYEDFNI